MSVPAWLADVIAGMMLAYAVYCVGRLVAGGLLHRRVERDVDVTHLVMAVAMAGMLIAALDPFDAVVWEVAFGVSTAWFGWRTVRALRRPATMDWHLPAHLMASGAMLYMFLAVRSSTAGAAMPGMAMGAAGGGPRTVRFPEIAVLLALYLMADAVRTLDRVTLLNQSTPLAGSGTRPLLAPRSAACCQATMGVAMGYVLITML
jgi:hypothetical protein